MPPSFDLGDDLSLRHLPDISDTSFSFQLPAAGNVDLLLADDAEDFFQGVDDSMLATPASARTDRQAALTLSEITPKRQPPHLFSRSSWMDQLSPTNLPVEGTPKQAGRTAMKDAKSPAGPSGTDARLRPHDASSRARTPTQKSPSTMARFETLKAEVEMLSDALRHKSTTIQEPLTRAQGIGRTARARNRGMSKSKPTIATGGIVKARSKNSNSTSSLVRHVTLVPQGQRVVLPESIPCATTGQSNPDTTISSPAGAVAERLVIYSQRLISSFGIRSQISSDIEPCPTHVESQRSNVLLDSVALSKDDGIGPEAPLTLSQISPRKPALPEVQTPSVSTPMSPLRSSSKRPMTVASNTQPCKKGKTISNSHLEASTSATQQQTLSASETRRDIAVSARRPSTRKVKARGAVQRKPPVIKPEDISPNVLVCNVPALGSTTLRESWAHNMDSPSAEMAMTRSGIGCSNDRAQTAAPPVKRVPRALANPTKPVGFTFQLDARMEARKAEFEKERLLVIEKQKTLRHQPLPVPDFKTLHAAQEADLALRKENILPVVPRPIELNTDSRARERGKFDEMMRAKQLELERAMEERRREAMEMEEREVRELRKKAIPRAHDVPEWYKEAPRRKCRDGGGTIGG